MAEKKSKLDEIMSRDDRGAKLAKNVLTRSFRDAVANSGVTDEKLSWLIEAYLRSPARNIDPEIRNDPEKWSNKLANDRGNLKKELENDKFTFKVFSKLVSILRPKDFTMGFHFTWHDGHEFKVCYQDFLEDEENINEVVVESFINEMSRLKEEGRHLTSSEIDGVLTDMIKDEYSPESLSKKQENE